MCHEVSVVVRRGARGKNVLRAATDVAADEGPLKRRQPRRSRSVIELARDWANRIESGQVRSQADLARQLGVTRQRVQQVLRLLTLVPEIQTYLVKTRDHDMRIRERDLRLLVRIGAKRDQVHAFRELVTTLHRR